MERPTEWRALARYSGLPTMRGAVPNLSSAGDKPPSSEFGDAAMMWLMSVKTVSDAH